MNRVLAAARLHLVHPLVILGIPWLVVAISFAINVAIWALTAAGEQDGGFTGGVLALYITVLVVYVQAVTQLLPFAMGVSLSRRTFYLGTALVAVVQSLFYGIALAILVTIENATGGWGSGLNYWAPGPFEVDNPALQVLTSGAPMLAFAFIGVGIGIVHKRWGQAGTWGLIIATMVVFGGLAILVSWLDAWGAVGSCSPTSPCSRCWSGSRPPSRCSPPWSPIPESAASPPDRCGRTGKVLRGLPGFACPARKRSMRP